MDERVVHVGYKTCKYQQLTGKSCANQVPAGILNRNTHLSRIQGNGDRFAQCGRAIIVVLASRLACLGTVIHKDRRTSPALLYRPNAWLRLAI